MSDLVAGHYPLFYRNYALNGNVDLRENFDRTDIVANSTLTSGTLYVYAVVVEPGFTVGAINVAVQTATATPTHSWAALYTGVGSTATLITQSADATGGLAVGAQKFTLTTPYTVGGTPGTPQGSAYTGGPSGAPVVLGVAIFNQGATGGKLDGMTGGAVAGEVVVTGQLALASSGTGITGATAPSTPGGSTSYAAAAGFVSYVALSRS